MSLYVTYQREKQSAVKLYYNNKFYPLDDQTKIDKTKYNSQINNPNHNNPNKYLTYKTHANNCLPNDCP